MSIGVRTDYQGQCERCGWFGKWTRDEDAAREQFRTHWQSIHVEHKPVLRVAVPDA